MYIVKTYPQISETYIKTEIEALREICNIRIVAAIAHRGGRESLLKMIIV